MSTSALYDTHRQVKRIAQTGVSEETAEAIVGSVTEIMAADIATKSDLAQMETRLTRWVFGITLALDSLLLAAIKLL